MTFTSIRNKVLHFLYIHIAKPIFFRMDPEDVHERTTRLGRLLGSNPLTRFLTKCLFSYSNKKLEQNLLGINFKNPIGLAAGFDKNAQLTKILPSVGFGHMEIGSITGEPCEGNPRPRLWRLKKSKSLLVYYGLKNDGCEAISKRLSKHFATPVSTSIAKTNDPNTVEERAGIQDYVKAYKHFTNIGAFSTINISCPNAFGGEPFTDPKKLDPLLTKIDEIKTKKPIFLKLSPDLPFKKIDELVKVAKLHKIDGFICTNLTKKRDNTRLLEEIPEKGGISGKVVEELSNNLIKH
ncbi:MAG: dihydroorotate dehydrogenase (quinone), partial [Candidatus Nanoarchaeia archaeon]